MATVLSIGDIAIIHYDTGTDAFSFVFLRDVEAGTTINFTDNGWFAAGGFRPGENTIAYTAPSAVTAGTIVTLSGLDLAAEGDQIIAYQGDPATPTILHLVDFADGNNTVAGDATDAQTTALPPGFTLGSNAVAIAFDSSLYAGPTSGSPAELFAAGNNAANWIDSNALPQPFRSNDRPDIDLDGNNSTHGGRDYETIVASGGPGVPIADFDININDDDDDDLFAAEIKVNGRDPEDLLTVNGPLPSGITAAAYDPDTGILRLNGHGSHLDYQQAILQVRFSTTDAPNNLKRIEVIVFDGDEWSPEGDAFVRVQTNLTVAAPGLDLDANNSNGGGSDYTATYTAGGPGTPIADVDVTITDADSTTLESATITIQNWNQPAGDTLSIAGPLPFGITASPYDPVNLTITLSGTASLADYQTALRRVVFSSTNPAPGTGDRGIQVVVNDGGVDSNIATTYMHVAAAANVAPVLNLDADSSTTGGVDYLTTFTGGGPAVAIVDTDVLITDGDDANIASATIRLTNAAAGDVLVFNGAPPPGIVASAYDPATGALTLTGTAPLASYQTALQQITFNSSGTPATETRVIEITVNDEAIASNVAHAIIEIDPGNAAAPHIDLDGNDSTAPGTTFRTTFIENGAAVPIADTDTLITDADSSNLAFATITLTNAQPGDLLSITGTLPAGIAASAYDPATGILTLTTISGTRTLADYQTALTQIRFSAAGDNPSTDDRVVQIVVNDGANDGDPATALVTVAAVNDAPTLSVAESATYTEKSAPLVLSPTVTLADIDDTDLSLAFVRIAGSTFVSSDMLTIGGATSGTIGGITFEWVEAVQALVINGTASVAAYQSLLQRVEFQSTSDNPTDFSARPTRTINWTVSDGSNTTTATTELDVVAVNDAPVASVAATATYTENAPPLVISPAATASDVDDINLVGGQVRIIAPRAGDILTVNGLQSGTFAGVDFAYDPAAGRLLFGHPATVADFQTFMQAVAFSSTSDDPSAGGLIPTRTLSWTLFDGDVTSDVQRTILTITALNDPPVAQDGSASGNEDTPITGMLVAADVDSPTLTYAIGTQAAHGTAVVNTDGSYTYTPSADFNGSDSFTFVANDGATDSNVATVSLSIAAVNDAPAAQDGNASGNEDTTLSGTLVATDVDSANLTYSLGTPAANGIVVVNPDGSYTYTPSADFNGSDSFTFVANDGATDSNVATVNLSIAAANDAPVAQDGNASGNEDTTLSGTLVATDVDSEGLTYRLDTQAAHGTVVVNPDGSYTYTPNADFNGSDSFTFVANDGAVDSNAATISLAIAAVADAPHLDLDGDDSTAASTYFATTFTGANVPVSDTDVAIADLDSLTLTFATIHLLTPISGDGLSVSGALPAGIGASAYDPATGILTLSGEAPLADYQTAIHQVEFGTTDTSLSSRIVEITVNDGTLGSNTAISTIDLEAPPEPPEPPPSTGDPHWMATRDFTPHPAGWSPIIVADFAGDDMSDLLWRSDSSGNLDEWQIANGGWTRSVDLGGHADAGLLPAAAGDFNGDGTDDLFWHEPASGNTDIWTMTNGEHAASMSPGLHPTGFQVAGTGDFDGDGTDDVLWFSAQTGEVDIWKIVSGQWADSVNPGASPAGFAIAATGDVNHDGSDDVVWFNSSSGEVQIWEMENGQLANVVDVGPHPAGYNIVGSADFTADGTDDILWFNPATNDVDLWKVQDSHWAGSVNIGLHPPGWQPIGIGDTDGNGIADVWWQQGATSTVETWMLSVQ